MWVVVSDRAPEGASERPEKHLERRTHTYNDLAEAGRIRVPPVADA